MTVAPSKVRLLGVPVTSLTTYAEAVEHVLDRVEAGRKTRCAAVNPEKIWRCYCDPAFAEIISSFELQICDGVGASWGARILYGKFLHRITGIQLFWDLVAGAAQREFPVFLLGATEDRNRLAAQRLSESHPNLQIAGRCHGYFDSQRDVVHQINRSGAKLVFVAMGSPRQEQWIDTHAEHVEAPFLMGVGGSLDVVSGAVAHAPALFRRTGTEFLYRLVKQPSRWRRQVILPLVAALFVGERWGVVKPPRRVGKLSDQRRAA